jgi:hypothetical protein
MYGSIPPLPSCLHGVHRYNFRVSSSEIGALSSLSPPVVSRTISQSGMYGFHNSIFASIEMMHAGCVTVGVLYVWY